MKHLYTNLKSLINSAAYRQSFLSAGKSVVARQHVVDVFLCAAPTPTNTNEQGESTHADEEVKLSHLLYSSPLDRDIICHFFIRYVVRFSLTHIALIKCRRILKYTKTYILLPMDNNGTANYGDNLLPETELGDDDFLISW